MQSYNIVRGIIENNTINPQHAEAIKQQQSVQKVKYANTVNIKVNNTLITSFLHYNTYRYIHDVSQRNRNTLCWIKNLQFSALIKNYAIQNVLRQNHRNFCCMFHYNLL